MSPYIIVGPTRAILLTQMMFRHVLSNERHVWYAQIHPDRNDVQQYNNMAFRERWIPIHDIRTVFGLVASTIYRLHHTRL